MKLRHDEVGKITGTMILALVIVGIVAYLGYGWYMQHKSATGSGITWTAVLENGDEIPITSSTTFYPSALALYSDSAHTTKIAGVKDHIWVTANTDATGFGDVTLTGSVYPSVLTPGTTPTYSSTPIALATQTIKLNTKTEITAWETTLDSSWLIGQASGSYCIGEKYTMTGVTTLTGKSVTLSGSQTLEGHVVIYWTADTLTIVPEMSWTTFTVV